MNNTSLLTGKVILENHVSYYPAISLVCWGFLLAFIKALTPLIGNVVKNNTSSYDVT